MPAPRTSDTLCSTGVSLLVGASFPYFFFRSASAFFTTLSTVKQNSLKSTFSGADSPKRPMVMVSPSSPTNLSHPKEHPASTARRYKEAGAQVLLISCSHFYAPNEARLKIDKNRALPIARASENQSFVFLANPVGTIQGRISLGKSMIVGPNGIVLSEAGETQEELLAIDIDPSFDWSW